VKKPGVRQLTPVELEIMKVLWRIGPATVQAVRAGLPSEPLPAYTTVQTMLNILFRKGRVKRVLKGIAYEYSAAAPRRVTVRHAVRDLVDRLFGGSTEDLVMNLIESRQLKPEELARIAQILRESRKVKEQGGDGT